jgi:hypothetical protein
VGKDDPMGGFWRPAFFQHIGERDGGHDYSVQQMVQYKAEKRDTKMRNVDMARNDVITKQCCNCKA